MHRECRERLPRYWLQRKPLVSDPGMHHDTCVTHVPWCMSGSLNRGGGENVPGIPGACATRNFTYLVRGPWGHAVEEHRDIPWGYSIPIGRWIVPSLRNSTPEIQSRSSASQMSQEPSLEFEPTPLRLSESAVRQSTRRATGVLRRLS